VTRIFIRRWLLHQGPLIWRNWTPLLFPVPACCCDSTLFTFDGRQWCRRHLTHQWDGQCHLCEVHPVEARV